MTGWAKWKNWMLREKRVTVTTWRFRLLVLLLTIALVWASYPAPLIFIGNSMLHTEKLEPADLILLENFDSDYSVFAAAHELVRQGYSSRILVPEPFPEENIEPDAVQKGFVEVMSRAAGIEHYETLPVKHIEPISLNVARQIVQFLEANSMRSVIVVSPGFRSARSYLVYDKVFTPRGIRVECFAAPSPSRMPDNWWHSWHGVQDTGLEFAKLLYYRIWVLRVKA